MCLCAIVAGSDPKVRGRGWKVFSETFGNHQLTGWMRGGPYETGKWYGADDKRLDCWILGGTPWYESVECHYKINSLFHYKSGFHIFLEKKDAISFSRGGYALKEVEWEGQCALGYDGSSGASIRPVVVAEKMRILPDEECSNDSVGMFIRKDQ